MTQMTKGATGAEQQESNRRARVLEKLVRRKNTRWLARALRATIRNVNTAAAYVSNNRHSIDLQRRLLRPCLTVELPIA